MPWPSKKTAICAVCQKVIRCALSIKIPEAVPTERYARHRREVPRRLGGWHCRPARTIPGCPFGRQNQFLCHRRSWRCRRLASCLGSDSVARTESTCRRTSERRCQRLFRSTHAPSSATARAPQHAAIPCAPTVKSGAQSWARIQRNRDGHPYGYIHSQLEIPIGSKVTHAQYF